MKMTCEKAVALVKELVEDCFEGERAINYKDFRRYYDADNRNLGYVIKNMHDYFIDYIISLEQDSELRKANGKHLRAFRYLQDNCYEVFDEILVDYFKEHILPYCRFSEEKLEQVLLEMLKKYTDITSPTKIKLYGIMPVQEIARDIYEQLSEAEPRFTEEERYVYFTLEHYELLDSIISFYRDLVFNS